MIAVTVEQMRELEARTIAAGTPAAILMERAGFAIARSAFDCLKHTDSRAILVMAGKGNNGGDAFVAARHLAAAGCQVTVCLVCRRSELRGDALAMFQQLTGVEVVLWGEELPATPAVIVDGLLGTGFAGEVRQPIAAAIEFINQQPSTILSIDVPSAYRVRADRTVTLGLPKVELLRHLDLAGRIEVADLGLAGKVDSDVELITRGDFQLPVRSRSAHKGDAGQLLVIGGSEGYTGAPVLTAHAAARCGVGLVTLVVPRNVYPIVAGHCPPEIIVRPLEGDLPVADAVAIGPGLGQSPEAQKLVWKTLSTAKVPVVVDADALNAVAQMPAALKKIPGELIFTPHPGEMGRLTGLAAREVQAARWDVARQFVRDYPVTLVLKGAGTVVTNPAGKLWINATGNPGMAKGGMGDALTGIIGALVAQGMPAVEAAKAGVHLHGTAGDAAAERCGVAGMLTSDLIAALRL